MVKREEFSRKVKTEAYERSGGKCESCGAILKPGGGGHDFHHDKPAYFFGRGLLENCVVLCTGCHHRITVTRDVPAIAKSRRIRAKQAGIKRRSRFAGSRDSPLKKKIDGTVERR
jgi:5-methylcytosine-specific restriction protein A